MIERLSDLHNERATPVTWWARLSGWILSVPVAWLVLGVALFVSGLSWQIARDELEHAQRAQFERRTTDVAEAVRKRMQDYEQVLRGGLGLFVAARAVSRHDWRAYVETLRIEEHYPGIQGIGFALYVPPAQRIAHRDAMRVEGFTDYDIHPPGVRAEYSAVLYLEPFDWRNQLAFGYDMLSEPVRRAALEQARDRGETTITSKVTLVQEADEEIQAGMLMYLPLYQQGKPQDTVAQRRAHLVGYVYSPFRMTDLMRGILDKSDAVVEADIDIELFDGTKPSAAGLLYDDDRVLHALDENPGTHLTRTETINLYNHTWTVHFVARPAFYAAFDQHKPWRLLFTGVGLSLLLSALIWLFATQRRRALALADTVSAEARATANRLRAIFDNVVDGIIAINEDGLIESANPAAERIFGYPAAELIGRNVNVLMPEPYGSQHDGHLHHFRETRERHIIGIGREVVGRRRDGTTFPLELSVSEIHADAGRLFIGVARDLTERRQVDRLKSEFVSTVSHELRTPLTAINGSIGLIAGGALGPLSRQASDLLGIAQKNCERLVRLINELLDFEKIESGKMVFDVQVVELMSLVRQAMETNRTYAVQHDVQFVLREEVKDVFVRVDPERFAQLMANLLSNAAKFSPPQQMVEISVRRQPNHVRVAVHDHGSGIPEEFRKRIFQRFAQADSSDARQKGGTGLGLSICKALVERFGGHIAYDSEPGRGTIFYFDLPLAPTPD